MAPLPCSALRRSYAGETSPSAGDPRLPRAMSPRQSASSQHGGAQASVLLEAKFEVMESGSTKTKAYHVVLQG